VNKVVDGKKHKHVKTQPKKVMSSPMKKLYGLQDEMFSEGFTQEEYDKYLQEKINTSNDGKDQHYHDPSVIFDGLYYYQRINEDDVQLLKKRYARLIRKEDNEYNERGDKMRMNRKQRKLFRDKKRMVIEEEKNKLHTEFFKEFGKTGSGAVVNRAITKLKKKDVDNENQNKVNGNNLLPTNNEAVFKRSFEDFEMWDETRKSIFIGASYLMDYDRKWARIYDKLTSLPTPHVLNLHSDDAMNQYVYSH